MKISTLIKREPFGDIFENTIMPFLHEYTGIEHKVCWNKIQLNQIKYGFAILTSIQYLFLKQTKRYFHQ